VRENTLIGGPESTDGRAGRVAPDRAPAGLTGTGRGSPTAATPTLPTSAYLDDGDGDNDRRRRRRQRQADGGWRGLAPGCRRMTNGSDSTDDGCRRRQRLTTTTTAHGPFAATAAALTRDARLARAGSVFRGGGTKSGARPSAPPLHQACQPARGTCTYAQVGNLRERLSRKGF
jgi:hypothetical protein